MWNIYIYTHIHTHTCIMRVTPSNMGLPKSRNRHPWVSLPFRVPRCLFWTSPSGCRKGDRCVFCHHAVAQEQAHLSTRRPRKNQRDQMKSFIKELVEHLNAEQEPQEVAEKWRKSLVKQSFVTKITFTRIGQEIEVIFPFLIGELHSLAQFPQI